METSFWFGFDGSNRSVILLAAVTVTIYEQNFTNSKYFVKFMKIKWHVKTLYVINVILMQGICKGLAWYVCSKPKGHLTEGWGYTYQANHECPCYKYSTADTQVFTLIWALAMLLVRDTASAHCHVYSLTASSHFLQIACEFKHLWDPLLNGSLYKSLNNCPWVHENHHEPVTFILFPDILL